MLTDWMDTFVADAEAAWKQFDHDWDWVRAFRDCPQDPIHHAEGNVWIHTRMVLDALVRSEFWIGLDRHAQAVTFAACLLHDIAKPWTTKQEGDRVTAKGHSAAGAVAARQWLWQQGVDPVDREHICALVLRHQLPFFAVDSEDGDRKAVLASCAAPLAWLAAVNDADGQGRVCADPQRLSDNVRLFRVMAEELGCWQDPFGFANPTARFRYARRESLLHDVPPEVFVGECFVMCGLPGSGKDTWVRTHQPDTAVVSLDALRAELGVDPREPQGRVANEGRERARQHMRKGDTFVWNATNITRQHRDRIVELAVAYRYKVTLVHVEAPADRLFMQNRRRESAVPEAVIWALLRKWQCPEVTEAHALIHVGRP